MHLPSSQESHAHRHAPDYKRLGDVLEARSLEFKQLTSRLTSEIYYTYLVECNVWTKVASWLEETKPRHLDVEGLSKIANERFEACWSERRLDVQRSNQNVERYDSLKEEVRKSAVNAVCECVESLEVTPEKTR